MRVILLAAMLVSIISACAGQGAPLEIVPEPAVEPPSVTDRVVIDPVSYDDADEALRLGGLDGARVAAAARQQRRIGRMAVRRRPLPSNAHPMSAAERAARAARAEIMRSRTNERPVRPPHPPRRRLDDLFLLLLAVPPDPRGPAPSAR